MENNIKAATISRIICVYYDLIALKTAEKIIRNIVTYTLTTSVVANKPCIDFYDYYVYDLHNVIDERY